MVLLLQLFAGIVVTVSVLIAFAGLLSTWGGVGSVELALLSVPAVLAGVWASRRVRRIFLSV